MRVVHVSTTDIRGGAARGAYSLHQALLDKGIDSLMLVAAKYGTDPSVRGPAARLRHQFVRALSTTIDALPVQFYRRPPGHSLFSPSVLPSNFLRELRRLRPDIVNLHWINDGFVCPEMLARVKAPLVWTLRDMWAFTGGCHYSQYCTRYVSRCGRCPQLGSGTDFDISRWLWRRKFRHWSSIDLTLVGLSQWIADAAAHSSLMRSRRIEVIHNGLDLSVFKPLDKHLARDALNLPPDDLLITYGAMNALTDPIKGFEGLRKAIQLLANTTLKRSLHVVIFGADEPNPPPDLGCPTTYLGVLHDDATLALAYSAADVMAVPSIQESFGKIALEGIACGTPVVCFDTSGLRDIVEHKGCGYRAEPYKSDDLASGIAWVLADADRRRELSARARQKAEREFSFELQAQRYVELYTEILEKRR